MNLEYLQNTLKEIREYILAPDKFDYFAEGVLLGKVDSILGLIEVLPEQITCVHAFMFYPGEQKEPNPDTKCMKCGTITWKEWNGLGHKLSNNN